MGLYVICWRPTSIKIFRMRTRIPECSSEVTTTIKVEFGFRDIPDRK